MSRDLSALLDAVDLETLADRLLGGHRGHGAGARWPSPVPDHPQTGRTPPMSIFTDRRGVQRWTCWATGTSGTAIDLVAVALRLDVSGAIAWLDDRHGTLPAPPTRRPPAVRAAVDASASGELLDYVTACQRLLQQPEGVAARRWLADRHLTAGAVDANQVGFDPGPHGLRRARGLPFRGPGIVLPVFDPDGAVVYAQVRYLDPARAGRKYDNPSAGHAAKPTLSWTRPTSTPGPLSTTIICEGTLDAMTVAGAGVRAVAVIAAGDASRCVDALAAIPGDLVVAMDPDPAGHAARQALLDGLDAAGRRDVAPLLVDGDLNDFAARCGPRFPAVLRAVLRSTARPRPGRVSP